MADVHGIADLPGLAHPEADPHRRANRTVPEWFGRYEQKFTLPVRRPVRVLRVRPEDDGFVLETAGPDAVREAVHTRTLVNATGTWTQPFVPRYPGQDTFLGEQLHTVDFPGPDWFAGRRTVVVGGGASAVQFLGLLAPVLGAEGLVWVTRRPPVWRTDEFTPEAGTQAVAMVAERVRAGLPPRSVVSVTGLQLRDQEREAARLGVYAARRPMFSRIEPYGVRWDGDVGSYRGVQGGSSPLRDYEGVRSYRGVQGGSSPLRDYEPAEVILWATGFRPAIGHLAPLHLRSASGGVRLDDDLTTAAADPRIQFVGYGPSASTIGANRAGRSAALGVRRALASATDAGTPCRS